MHSIVKKTLEQIVGQGAHYLVRVKANSQRLLKEIKAQCLFDSPTALYQPMDHSSRLMSREIHCFAYQNRLPQWEGASIQTLIRVERRAMRKEGPYLQTAYYITDHQWSEKQAATAIKAHWQIENRLHWVKDVVLKEDLTTPKTGYGPQNLALINSMVISLFRQNGFESITRAIRLLGHDFQKLIDLLMT